MSNHDRVHGQLADYVTGRLRRGARARVESHLAACPSCRAELAALERTGAILDAMEPVPAPEGTWQAVQREITDSARVLRPIPARWGWRVAATAVALLVIALAAFVLRPHRAPSPPLVVVAVEVDDEMGAAVEGHLATVWASPLADEAAVGLRFASLEEAP